MNKFLVVLIFLPVSITAYTAEEPEINVEGIREALIEATNNPKPWIPPALEPSTILHGIEDFVVSKKKMRRQNYYFTGLVYNFREALWEANYICKPQNGVAGIDCGFRVFASNDSNIEYRFELYP